MMSPTNTGVRMDMLGWLLTALTVSLAIVAVASRLRPVQSWQAERLAVRVGLGVPSDLADRLRARVATRMLASAIGGLIGIAVATVALVATHHALSNVDGYIAAAAAIAGYATGSVWAAFSTAFEKDDRPRIARLTTVSLSAYVPALARVVLWALLLVACATVVVDVGPRHLDRAVVLAPLVGVAGLSTLLLEVLGRRLIARGQAATSTDELVWDDALRSSSLNEVVDATQRTLAFVLLGCAAVGFEGGNAWVFLPAGLLVVGLVLLRAMLGQARTWYLDELWPGARRRTAEEEAARSSNQA